MITLETDCRTFENLVLVCDMDGTLLDSKRQLSDENRAALEYFVNNGGRFTVATGRMQSGIAKFVDYLPINVPAILNNGAVIYDTVRDEVLWECCLDEGLEDVIQGLVKHFPDIGVEVFNRNGINIVKENYETYVHGLREEFLPGIRPLENIPRPWYKVLLAWEPHLLDMVREYLDTRVEPFRSVKSEPEFLELLNPDVSKGHALEKLAGFVGFRVSDVVAVGDNMNDLELLKTAGRGVAVENAHASLKQVACYLSCHHDGHAVADVVRWLMRG